MRAPVVVVVGRFRVVVVVGFVVEDVGGLVGGRFVLPPMMPPPVTPPSCCATATLIGTRRNRIKRRVDRETNRGALVDIRVFLLRLLNQPVAAVVIIVRKNTDGK